MRPKKFSTIDGVTLPAGSNTLKSLHLTGSPALGLYFPSATSLFLGDGSKGLTFDGSTWTFSGATAFSLEPPLVLAVANPLRWGTNAYLYGDVANTISQKNGNVDQLNRLYGGYGGYWEHGVTTELVTIAAAATSTSVGDLLPADSIIEAVNVRVTVVIPTAETFTVGDGTSAARFGTGIAVAADTTNVGIVQHNPANADTAGPVQAAAAKIVITPSAQPAAATGRVRVQVFYSHFVSPTS